MNKSSLVLLVVILFLARAEAQSCSGGSCGTRGGGDILEWSFFDVVKSVTPVLASTYKADLKTYIEPIKTVVTCLQVEVSNEDRLELDGRSVMAINIPSQCKVILSKVGWESIQDKEARVRLVVHELLSLALIQDFQYEISRLLTNEYFHLSQTLEVAEPNKSMFFQESGLLVVPLDVTRIRVTVVGGGGGGGGGHLDRGLGGGGGGGGAVRTRDIIVKGIREIVITVGKGGAGARGGGFNGSRGEISSFGNYVIAEGGGGGFSGYYNTSMAYGGTGGGSGGGGGGNGSKSICSGAGGKAGSPGENGFVSRTGGAGGAGGGWDSLDTFIHLQKYFAGSGGGCVGLANVYNGGGGGGGLVIGDVSLIAQAGGSSPGKYSGVGGTGGEGYGSGGGGGTGAEGSGGAGASGVVYIEYFSSL